MHRIIKVQKTAAAYMLWPFFSFYELFKYTQITIDYRTIGSYNAIERYFMSNNIRLRLRRKIRYG